MELGSKYNLNKDKRMSLKTKEALTGWLFLSPALIGF